MVITAQTLYSATAANAKEFAILLALGIPRWRISMMVLTQSFWVGIIGIALAYPICLGLRYAALQFGNDVDLRWEVLAGTAVLTIGMALIAGVLALRSVRQIEPMSLAVASPIAPVRVWQWADRALQHRASAASTS